MATSARYDVNMRVINLLNYGLAFFESTEDAFQGKMYRMASRNIGSGFPLLFSHLQVMFKIHKEVLGRFEATRSLASSSVSRGTSVSDQFAFQVQHANTKLEEFVLMLLDSFHLSESASHTQTHSPQIVIRLLVEIINSMPIIHNEELKASVIEACVRYFLRLPLIERDVFV